jgi:hypothetical protein
MRARVCACGMRTRATEEGRHAGLQRAAGSAARACRRTRRADPGAARAVGAKKKAEVRERAVAQTLPQLREWYVVRGVRIGIFSAQAFQYFEKHPELVFAKPKLVKAVVVEPQRKKARR